MIRGNKSVCLNNYWMRHQRIKVEWAKLCKTILMVNQMIIIKVKNRMKLNVKSMETI